MSRGKLVIEIKIPLSKNLELQPREETRQRFATGSSLSLYKTHTLRHLLVALIRTIIISIHPIENEGGPVIRKALALLISFLSL